MVFSHFPFSFFFVVSMVFTSRPLLVTTPPRSPGLSSSRPVPNGTPGPLAKVCLSCFLAFLLDYFLFPPLGLDSETAKEEYVKTVEGLKAKYM